MGQVGFWQGFAFTGHELGTYLRALGSKGTDVVTESHHSGGCIEHSLLNQTRAGKQERQSFHDRSFLRIGAGGGNEWLDPEYAGVT